MRAFVRVDVILKGADRAEAAAFGQKLVDEIEDGWGHDATFDVQNVFSSGDPPASPTTHPWDQGLWIFPETHPMRWYEERAKKGDEGAHEVLDQAIQASQKLPSALTTPR